MALRVGSLCDVIADYPPVWLRCGDFQREVMAVRTVGEGGTADIEVEGPYREFLGEFEDQRVKLDTDIMEMTVKDIHGTEYTLRCSAVKQQTCAQA